MSAVLRGWTSLFCIHLCRAGSKLAASTFKRMLSPLFRSAVCSRASGGAEGNGTFEQRSQVQRISEALDGVGGIDGAFGTRGKLRTLPPGRREVNIAVSRKEGHSKKPGQVYEIIERCSPGPNCSLAQSGGDDFGKWAAEHQDILVGDFDTLADARASLREHNLACYGVTKHY